MATYPKPIGIILQEAKLITSGQLEVALYEQKQFQMLLGEILSHHGWISQETADFFVDRWPTIVNNSLHQPIGYYLKLAHLLNEDQIEGILRDQLRLGVRFGTIAVLKGWLKEETIDFFVKSIADRQEISPPLLASALPVPQLKILRRQLSPFMEAQAKETYPQRPISKSETDFANVDKKGHQPAQTRQNSPRQAAETLILFDDGVGDRQSVQAQETSD